MELNIKCRCMVRPAGPTWNGRQSLSELDQINSLTHTQIIYLYQEPRSSHLEPCTTAIADVLRASLSEVLVTFYPLAGRLRPILLLDDGETHHYRLEFGGRLELDCNGDGVEFLEVELDAALAEFQDYYYKFAPSPKYRSYLFPFIDYSLPIHEIPVLFVQLTKFNCGGIGLSFSFSHVVLDGLSMAHFLREWASVARDHDHQRLSPTTPFQKMRTEVLELPQMIVCNNSEQYFLHLPRLIEKPSGDELKKMMKRTVVFLRLGKTQVEKLKKTANHNNNDDNTDGNRNDNGCRDYTRYEAVAAHIWRCASMVRKHRDEQPTTNILTVDVRRRLKPPLPVGYFGNAILDVKTTSFAGGLASKPLGYAASRIRTAIEKVTNEYVLSTVDYLKSQQDLSRFRYLYSCYAEGYLGNPNVAVMDWSKLPAYELDFGWGKEVYFGPGNLEIDGDSVILCDRSEDGSLVVVLCIQVEHVDDFKKHFYKDIVNSSL